MAGIVAQDLPGKRVLLMGNEAIARGAVEAGVEVVAAYPGTPSSEICETLAACAEELGYYIEWSANEKVAFEVAAGAALVGARSLVAMKNAGLNVAMDTFITLPYTGIKGGMVIVVADDPDAHYSSTEQDTRMAAMYAEILCLEPADQQEAKDMTKEAFELSERLSLPVFVRSVTRISHASGDVVLGTIRRERSALGFNKHWKLPYRWDVYGPPGGAAVRHKWLHEQLPKVAAAAEGSAFNESFSVGSPTGVRWQANDRPGSGQFQSQSQSQCQFQSPGPGAPTSASASASDTGRQAKFGVIASGLGSSYAREALGRFDFEGAVPFLKLGTAFPIPGEKVCQLLSSAENVLVVEEGDPVVEVQVKALACDVKADVRIFGKTTRPEGTARQGEARQGGGTARLGGSTPRRGGGECAGALAEGVLPLYGELNTDTVARAVEMVTALVFPASGPNTAAASGAGATAASCGAVPCVCSARGSCGEASASGPGSVSGDSASRGGSAVEHRDAAEEIRSKLRSLVAPRSSTLCAGCPHLGSYWALREVLRSEKGVHIVNGDIGCYEQGGYGIFSRAIPGDEANSKRYRVSSPYEILDTIYVMGSGIGLAMGQAQAGYSDGKVVAVAGDSTFFHATLPAVVNAVYTGANITFLVFDNSWTCMTGHQPSPTTGISTTGRKARTISIEDVAKSIGIESLTVVDAYDVAAAKAAIKEAVTFKSPSMVVLRRECALQVQRRERRKGTAVTHVEREACTGCRLCVELGCPAVAFDAAAKKAGIDEILCVDCGLCAQVCPRGAIKSAMGSSSDARGAGAGARR